MKRTIESRTLRLLLRDNLRHNAFSRDCRTSRTLKSYESKVRRGLLKDTVWEQTLEASAKESAALLKELGE